MPTMCFMSFPSPEIKTATDSILKSVTDYITGKFPQNVIKQVFIDVQDKMRDIYKNALNYYSGKLDSNNNLEEMLKIPKPHLFVGYQFSDGFESTNTGLGETQPYFFPNAFYMQEHMQSVLPILKDEDRRILLGTYNLRIKVTAEFAIACSNREEQFNLYNYILNFLRMYYIQPLCNIKASFIMPDYMMTFLLHMMHGKEAKIDDVYDEFNDWLNRKSAGAIYPVYRNNKEKDRFYEMKYIYNRIDFRLTNKPQMDDATKQGDVPDTFLVRFPIEIEFYIPTNFVLRCPELIPDGKGNVFQIPDYIAWDEIPNKDIAFERQKVIKKYFDRLRREPAIEEKGYELVMTKEFTLSSITDGFSLTDLLNKDNLIIFNCLLPEERKKVIKVCIYENDTVILDYPYMDIDEDWNIYIKEGSLTTIYTMELYLNTLLITKIIEEREKQLAKKKSLKEV